MQFRAFLGLFAIAVVIDSSGLHAADEPDPDRAADEKTLKDAGVKNDGASLLAFFRKRTSTDADHDRLLEAVRLLGDDNFRTREKATARLTAAGKAALPFLRSALRDPDTEVVFRAKKCIAELERTPELSVLAAAARLLAVHRPPQTVETLLAYTPMIDDEYVREAVFQALTTTGLKDGKAHPAIVEAAGNSQPARRAAAAHVLSRAGDSYRKPVQRLLADTDAYVRFQAAEGLIRRRDKSGVSAMILLLTDGPPQTAWQAEDMLCRLASTAAPPVSLGKCDELSRKQCREAWEKWWTIAAATADLSKLDGERTGLGLTIICDCDVEGNYRIGSVWECAADDTKPRWQIKGVKNPADAQLLPGGRVLVAECQGFVVTERDREGKVLWSQTVDNYPVSCRRLPNGNTFIATYTEILEVTRDGKKEFSRRLGSSVFCAQKLPNGNILYAHSHGRIVEMTPLGTEVRSIEVGGLSAWASVEPLPNGRWLVAQYSKNMVIEVDENGRTHWECPVQTPAWCTRLPNGNTLVACTEGHCVIEFDRLGKEVWKRETPGRPFRVLRH
jgi:HEAT repeat protein